MLTFLLSQKSEDLPTATSKYCSLNNTAIKETSFFHITPKQTTIIIFICHNVEEKTI